jgi:hypothetical protein
LGYFDRALRYKGDRCIADVFKEGAKITVNGQGRSRVTRYVCEKVNGPPPTPKHEAAHHCGNGHWGCVTPRHLYWATSKENHADAIRHGTTARGERNVNAKLKASDIPAIRSLIAQGVSQCEVGRRYGVSNTAVWQIVRSRSWAWAA